MKAGDKNQLASMVAYPLRSFLSMERIQIRNRDQFLNLYPQLLTPAVVCAIKAAKTSDVWGNYQGFMIGMAALVGPDYSCNGKNPDLELRQLSLSEVVAINSEDVMVPGYGGMYQTLNLIRYSRP